MGWETEQGGLTLMRAKGVWLLQLGCTVLQAQEKASSKIVGIDGELVSRGLTECNTRSWPACVPAVTLSLSMNALQCYNISTKAPLTASEAETLAWLLRETFEPELLTSGTEFANVAAGDTVVEVWRLLRLLLPCCCYALCTLHGDKQYYAGTGDDITQFDSRF